MEYEPQESPSVEGVPAPPPTLPVSPIANFWARIAAFLVDVVLLSVVAAIIAGLLGNDLYTYPTLARLIGLALVLSYFGIMQSTVGGGQTHGQRLFHLKVVDRHGALISLPRALCRAFILWLPALLNHLPVSLATQLSPTGLLLGFVLFATSGGLCYFYLFNRITRQSLHDLLCGTYVVRECHREPIALSMSPVHYRVFPTLIALFVIGGILLLQLPLFRGMAEVANYYEKVPGGVVTGINVMWLSTGQHYLSITVMPDGTVPVRAVVAQVEQLTLQHYPQISQMDQLIITAHYQRCLLLHTNTKDLTWYRTPQQWQLPLPEQPDRNGAGWSVP